MDAYTDSIDTRQPQTLRNPDTRGTGSSANNRTQRSTNFREPVNKSPQHPLEQRNRSRHADVEHSKYREHHGPSTQGSHVPSGWGTDYEDPFLEYNTDHQDTYDRRSTSHGNRLLEPDRNGNSHQSDRNGYRTGTQASGGGHGGRKGYNPSERHVLFPNLACD